MFTQISDDRLWGMQGHNSNVGAAVWVRASVCLYRVKWQDNNAKSSVKF